MQSVVEDRGLIEIDVYGELIDECGRSFVGLQVGNDENEARPIDAVLPERGERYFLVADVDSRRRREFVVDVDADLILIITENERLRLIAQAVVHGELLGETAFERIGGAIEEAQAERRLIEKTGHLKEFRGVLVR